MKITTYYDFDVDVLTGLGSLEQREMTHQPLLLLTPEELEVIKQAVYHMANRDTSENYSYEPWQILTKNQLLILHDLANKGFIV